MEEPSKQIYTYDFLMISTSLPMPEELSDRTYSVRLFDEFIDLPEDRQYVTEFEGQPLGELMVNPCDLIKALCAKGVCLTVHDLGTFKGSGLATMESHNLRALAERSCDIEQEMLVMLTIKGRRVGKALIKVRITCTDPDLDTTRNIVGCYDICRPLDRVAPNDMMITLGRSRTCPTNTAITDERLMTHAGNPFSCTHRPDMVSGEDCACVLKGVKVPPELDKNPERERKLLKRLLNDLAVDRERVPEPPASYGMAERCKCKRSKKGSVSGDDRASGGLAPHQLEEIEFRRRCPEISTPNLTYPKYKPELRCRVCRANITWLPKLAACPYCGYMRMDLDKPSEEPFDETATAAQVLRNHYLTTREKLKYDADQQIPYTMRENQTLSETSEQSGKCTCTKTRICTKCHLKELSDGMPKMPNARNTIPHTASGSTTKKNLKSPSPSEHRKKLISIFKEMREFYGEKNNSEQAKEICHTAMANKMRRAVRRVKCVKKHMLKELKKYPKLRKTKVKPRMPSKRSKRYIFLKPAREPFESRTHKQCTDGTGRVPCHMGWLWTHSELGQFRCWKPGAVMRPIRELMAYFLRDYPADVINPSRYHCPHRRRPGVLQVVEPVEEEQPLVQHPMLHITKKEDEYVITLRPLKRPDVLSKSANPFEEMEPMVFRISKDPIMLGMREIKRALKEKGFPTCTCRQPVAKCFCRSYLDQKVVAYEVKRLSEARGWQDVGQTLVYEDSSESEEEDSEKELDFGVTPPAGVIKPERRRRPDRVNVDTQYADNDWAMPTMYPHPPNPHVQYGGCVTGERKGRFTWILGKGHVNVEPKPPKQINKPLKKPQQAAKKAPARLKGGFDDRDPQYSVNVRTKKRKWHKSNQPRGTTIVYDNGPIR